MSLLFFYEADAYGDVEQKFHVENRSPSIDMMKIDERVSVQFANSSFSSCRINKNEKKKKEKRLKAKVASIALHKKQIKQELAEEFM